MRLTQKPCTVFAGTTSGGQFSKALQVFNNCGTQRFLLITLARRDLCGTQVDSQRRQQKCDAKYQRDSDRDHTIKKYRCQNHYEQGDKSGKRSGSDQAQVQCIQRVNIVGQPGQPLRAG